SDFCLLFSQLSSSTVVGSSSRNRSKRPAASLAQSITGTIVTTLQALMLCLFVESDEVVVELLLACFTAIMGTLPLPCVSLVEVAHKMRPVAATDQLLRTQAAEAALQSAQLPQSAFILKRQA